MILAVVIVELKIVAHILPGLIVCLCCAICIQLLAQMILLVREMLMYSLDSGYVLVMMMLNTFFLIFQALEVLRLHKHKRSMKYLLLLIPSVMYGMVREDQILFAASGSGDLRRVKEWRRRNPNTNPHNKRSENAIHKAVRRSHGHVARYLIA